MPVFTEAALLRINIGDDDTYGEQPLFEAIIAVARDAGLAGTTVLRGIAGYGRSTRIHETFRGFANDLPIVVEIVDTFETINSWLDVTGDLLRDAIVTVESVRTVQLTRTKEI